ncbi:hypothetical protein pb186bvf_000252 [Paramecium bursaria]
MLLQMFLGQRHPIIIKLKCIFQFVGVLRDFKFLYKILIKKVVQKSVLNIFYVFIYNATLNHIDRLELLVHNVFSKKNQMILNNSILQHNNQNFYKFKTNSILQQLLENTKI